MLRKSFAECKGHLRRSDFVASLLAELKACRDLRSGKRIHETAVQSGHGSCLYVSTALVAMYAKCNSMTDARRVFDSIKHPSVVSWTALILGYAENGEGVKALDLFARMKSEGCAPDSVAFIAALKACASLALEQDTSRRAECLERGRQIHSSIGCQTGRSMQNTLVYMYAKCGSMVDARQVFESIQNPDVIAWTVLILGYAENGEGVTALEMFARMKTRSCVPNLQTFVAALKACASVVIESDELQRAECLAKGKRIHSEISPHSDAYVQNALIDMYAKCGSMADARQVFDSMTQQCVTSWTALILGYAKNGEGVEALDLFARMKTQGCEPDCITFVAALKACSLLGALESGRKIHAEIGTRVKPDAILVACLVDFYARCGSMGEAKQVFDAHRRIIHLSSWNALLAGYSGLGDTQAVLELFKGMQESGLLPNGITCSCVLTCCSHVGLVEKANEFFEAMATKHSRTTEHYNCMVDAFGRSNKLNEAVALVRSMPCRPDAVTWRILLSACGKWKCVGIGRLAFKSLVTLDDSNGAPYVLLGLIYGSRGMFEEQEMVLQMKRQLKGPREAAQSIWTNEAGEIHTFQGS